MTRGLTEKQEHILQFILEYISERGYPPSIREIGANFSISSLRGVTVHLDALQRKGYITRSNTARAITVIGQTGATSPSRNVTVIPLLGQIAAGIPITSIENIEGYVPVPQDMVHNIPRAFVLRVKGDSMIGAHIMDGDLVVIRPQDDAVNGEIVAARLGDEGTIKRFLRDKDGVSLIAENPDFAPINVRREDSQIIGKVIGLLRNFDGPLSF